MKTVAVSPVIATILMVAIAVVLVAVLYIMALNMMPSTGKPAPLATLIGEPKGENLYQLTVAGIDKKYNLDHYKVIFLINDTIDNNSCISSLSEGTFGNVTFHDVGDDGKLSNGDFFTVTITHNHKYELIIVFKMTGDTVASYTWVTS